jgi:hypothetical protein
MVEAKGLCKRSGLLILFKLSGFTSLESPLSLLVSRTRRLMDAIGQVELLVSTNYAINHNQPINDIKE